MVKFDNYWNTLGFSISFPLAFANFLDPRVWTIEILGFQIMLHLIFAGATLIIFLPLADRLLGDNGALALSGLLLASQLLFLVVVPFLVEAMMTNEHYFRPGSPHTTWAAHAYLGCCFQCCY